jgi:hypothetical protein
MSEDDPSSRAGMATIGNDDFIKMDDSALLSWRAEIRAELERLPLASAAHIALTALYDESTHEVDARARRKHSGPLAGYLVHVGFVLVEVTFPLR